MRRLMKILLAVLLVLGVALVAGYWYERPMLLTGTGYAAHNACAIEKVAGRDNPEADLPPNPLVPVLRSDVGEKRTTSSILGLLAKQRAHFAENFGCTISGSAPDLPQAVRVDAGSNPFTALPETTGPKDVEAAIDHAFGLELSAEEQAELGTRGVVVVKDGELVAERYAEGFDKDTPQLGWSMSKSVADVIVGRLVLQNKVSLDDKNLVPDWKDDRKDITIRQLMQMTSGLEWDETYDLGTPITKMLYIEPDMGGYVATQKLAHKPGTHLQYSSGSTNLLCSIIAKDNGGANLPRTQIFAPLGLSSAIMEPDGAGTPVCSSYMWATPRDWATFGQFVLQDGVWEGERLLPEGWAKQSAEAVKVESSDEDRPYASGWWPNKGPDGKLVEPRLPEDAFFAQGHDGQRITIVPSQNLVVVRLGFSPAVENNRSLDLSAALSEIYG